MSLQRTWACVIAASVLYMPANMLPIMSTTSALQRNEHTLLGGIHELWIDGSWILAIIVFVASIAVPVLKIARRCRCWPGACAARRTGGASSGRGSTG